MHPKKIRKGAWKLYIVARPTVIMNTIASAYVFTDFGYNVTQPAAIRPTAAAFNPFNTALNQAKCLKRDQKGSIAKIKMKPGPNKPRKDRQNPGNL